MTTQALNTSNTSSSSSLNPEMDEFYLVKPWKHQKKGVIHALQQGSFAFFFEQGTGKTATGINVYRGRCALDKRMYKALVLCPPVVVRQWKGEFDKNSRLGDRAICLQGSQVERIKTLKANPNACVFITNYESLLMKNLFEELLKLGINILIFDESHKLKNPQAKRAKQAEILADQADFRLILTGTPILNSPMDIFQQFRVMDGGATFGKNFWAFRATYFYDRNAGMPRDRYFPDWVPRPGCLEDINAKVYTRAMRVVKSECLDLPPLVRQELTVELSPEQRSHYNAMMKEFITFVKDKACTAQLAITKSLRLQQILSGFIKMEDGTEIVFEDNPRLAALKEQLEEITPQHKVIIWATFKQNYRMIARICEELGIKYTELHGEVSAADREKNIQSFRADPQVKVIIANPQAGGVGVNLIEASFSIWYSRSFRLEDDLQADARNHRGGSEMHEKITRIDLVAQDTMDELVLGALKDKQNIADVILDWKDSL